MLCKHCEKRINKKTSVIGYYGKVEIEICFSCTIDDGCYYFCKSCRKFTEWDYYDTENRSCGHCGKLDSRDIVYIANEEMNDYSYNGDIQFFVGNKKALHTEIKNNVFFGIELELEATGKGKFTPRDFTAVFGNKANFGYDGSLNNGVEIRTNPMTFDGIYRSGIWDSFFKRASRSKYFKNKSARTGIHIHVSDNAFYNDYPEKIAEFFCKYREVIQILAERNSNYFCQYGGRINDKYSAINYSNNYDTVEIRIFQSVLDKTSFFKNIEFVRALIDYGRKNTDEDEIDFSKFFKMVAKDHKLYPNLIRFMKKNEILNRVLKDVSRQFKIVVYSKELKAIPARFNKIKHF